MACVYEILTKKVFTKKYNGLACDTVNKLCKEYQQTAATK